MNPRDALICYDRNEHRLIYLGRSATEDYWDDHWSSSVDERAIKRSDPFVVKWTQKHLPNNSRVLDAGCGLANTVWGLKKAGFDASGIDYAASTVDAINRLVPELNVVQGDVRSLPFDDEYFNGIWSLGVIEHFPEGYATILDEMWRVLKPGGKAFVTVPSMSPLRRLKARAGAYPHFDGDYTDFYQFVLSPEAVVESFTVSGWQFLAGTSRGGFKGLKDEAGPLRPALQAFYDLKYRPARVARAGLNRVLAPISFHTRLYVFQKPL